VSHAENSTRARYRREFRGIRVGAARRELASGQVRLELWLDEAAGVSRDVVLPAGTAYDVVNQGVYETSRSLAHSFAP
jgi:hypothetical protein